MIPPSPHRPSIDDFWSQDVINDWNDEYSQRKVLRSDHRRPVLSVPENGDEEPLPLAFPPRSPTKTPLKRNKKAFESRRAFTEKNHGLALDFLKELDDTIANGKVASLAAPTGGIRLIWSKTLNSTAGRANWRQEIIKSSENNDGLSETYRHHASIELAEKVIDDEGTYRNYTTKQSLLITISGRLINVIAHEYCHLANFMISGVKNNPHGKQFKEW